MKEIKDIAMWEETDSELAKYTIGKLQEENKQLKEQLEYLRKNQYLNQVKWERDFNEYLVKELKSRIDKAIDFINAWKDNKTDLKVSMLDLLQIEDILRGKDE